MFLPTHFMVTFEEAFYTGFFEFHSNLFSFSTTIYVADMLPFMQMEKEMPLKDVLADAELE